MSLAEALAKITKEDLEQVNQRIAELESELDTQKELRRIIEIKLGVRKPLGAHLRGSKRKSKTADLPTSQNMGASVRTDDADDEQFTATERHRMNARKVLLQSGQPVPVPVICKSAHIPSGSITNVLRHPWFQDTGRGVMLTHDGKAGVGL